jgi:hypothetical protein
MYLPTLFLRAEHVREFYAQQLSLLQEAAAHSAALRVWSRKLREGRLDLAPASRPRAEQDAAATLDVAARGDRD